MKALIPFLPPRETTVPCAKGSAGVSEMTARLITSVALIFAGYLGLQHRAEITDLYRAAYPDDPAERAALDECSRGISNFNRLAATDRNACYANLSGRLAVSAVPYNPSHLPVNDIRRQEVFDGYRSAQGAAAVSMVPPPSHE
jgi:hypothetical protein